METIIKEIPINLINDNPYNERSMNHEQISVLADSILHDGLLQPVVVYKTADGRYTLLSGHRRKAACQLIIKDSILTKINETPTDEWEEQELLAKANFHRLTPKEIQNEVSLADRIWGSMNTERRERLSKEFIAKFKERVADNPKYIENPAEFVRRNCRTRLEYINYLTGLEMSNTTVKSILSDIKKTETGEGDDEIKVKEPKPVKAKDIVKAADKLLGLLEVYVPTPYEAVYVNDAKDVLLDLKQFVGVE